MAARQGGWTEADVPDQSHKTAVVTGANSGLGFETSRVLFQRGAHVIMAVRRVDAGLTAASAITGLAAHSRLSVVELDLGNLESVRRFARALSVHPTIDLLVNNAGIMAVPRQSTVDGFDRQLGINHLGHFALTGHLLPQLLADGGGRVVTVSSDMHRMGQIRFDDLQGARRYGPWSAYGQSKLANLYFAYELARRARAVDARLLSMAAHPGYAATNLQLRSARERGKAERFWRGARRFAQSAARGALPQLRAATDPDAQTGTYYGPRRGLAGSATIVESSRRSHDENTARRLWEVSVDLTGAGYDFSSLSW
ncbi:MAG TPA: oxidoreductase [Acidimicrobiia bacterium]|nr:oxidoreductase [Acidimicrobiia bacterium]